MILRHGAAAHEMNNLNAIASLQSRLGPIVAAHDIVIEFNGHAGGFEIERGNQSRQCRFVRHLSRFAV